MVSRNERHSSIPSWARAIGEGTSKQESRPGHRGNSGGIVRHSSNVASQNDPSFYRFYVRAYSATFASGFAVYGIVELFTRK